MSIFKTLSEINVNDHVEQKGRFKYLSWTWAVSELRKASPTATWEVIKFNGLPFCKTETGYFVEVAVTVDGITLSQIHPVLDNNNKTIPVPSAFQINTSIQRCLVKAIALHGLGLYIYAGEDLPDVEPEKTNVLSVTNGQAPKTPLAGALENFSEEEISFLREQAEDITLSVRDGQFIYAHDVWNKLDNEEKTAAWSMMDSKTRSTFKKYQESLKQEKAAA
jgi:hypothetical protein